MKNFIKLSVLSVSLLIGNSGFAQSNPKTEPTVAVPVRGAIQLFASAVMSNMVSPFVRTATHDLRYGTSRIGGDDSSRGLSKLAIALSCAAVGATWYTSGLAFDVANSFLSHD